MRKNDLEDIVIRLEITKTEKERLVALAARSGLTVNEYIKRAVGF